jgi:hypothetical protein
MEPKRHVQACNWIVLSLPLPLPSMPIEFFFSFCTDTDIKMRWFELKIMWKT